jgi:hypothetical protein
MGAGPVEAARIGWRRARSFNGLNRGARSPAGALLAPWWWPVETLLVASNAGNVRTLGGASMTLSDGTRRPSWPLVVAAGFLAALEFGVMLAVAIALPLALGLAGSPAVVGFVAVFGVLAAPLLLDSVARWCAHLRAGPRVRSLATERSDLARRTDRPVYVMSSFVRSTRPGEGSRLLRALQGEWQRTGAVVLLHPANKALADYYSRQGAEQDGDTHAVMRFGDRPAVTA